MTKQELKDSITLVINSNGNGGITGTNLQEKLLEMVDLSILGFPVPTEELTSDDLGKIVGLEDNKAVLMGVEGQMSEIVGKWRISINSLPTAPISRKIRIDFTNINFSEFLSFGEPVFLNTSGNSFYFRSIVNSPNVEIPIGSTLIETIDNLMNFINDSDILNYTSCERTGLYLDVDLCDPSFAPVFFSTWDSRMITVEGFLTNTASTTIIRNEDNGFLDHSQILYDANSDISLYLGDFNYLNNAILQSFVDGYSYSNILYNYFYMPLDFESYLQQILAIAEQYYTIEDIQSDSFIIVGNKATYTLSAPSDTITLLETIEPVMASEGYINSSFLGELLYVSNGKAIINPSETFKVISESEEILVGDFLTVNFTSKTGKVIKVPSYDKNSDKPGDPAPKDLDKPVKVKVEPKKEITGIIDSYASYGIPIFIAITNGMEPYVKLFDKEFYLYFSSSSSSSSYNSGAANVELI